MLASPIVPPRFERKFTAIATQAMDFATLFHINFAGGLPGLVYFKIELTTPVGPSTEGGKQALQHVRLIPADGTSAIVIGSTSQVGKTADIRTLRHLRDVHAMRYKGAPFPVDGSSYQDLVARLQQFFAAQGHAVVMLDAATPSMAPPAPSSGGAVSGTMVVIVVVATILLASVVGALVIAQNHWGFLIHKATLRQAASPDPSSIQLDVSSTTDRLRPPAAIGSPST